MTTRVIHLRDVLAHKEHRLRPGDTRTGDRSPGGFLGRLFGRFASGLARADTRYRERRYLTEMDERALKDIGITRADVDAELRRPVDWLALLLRG